MSKDSHTLEQALKDAWLAGYDAAVERDAMSWKIRRDDERYYVDANTMPGAQKALHLAAAAPELLEALELVVSFVDAGEGTWTVEEQQKARAAIAKAKGE